MNTQTKIIEQNQREADQLEAIAKWAADVARQKRLNVNGMNLQLLWSEWYFTKALNDWGSSNDTAAWFDEACANLEVDSEGEPLGRDPEAEADYRYDLARDAAA